MQTLQNDVWKEYMTGVRQPNACKHTENQSRLPLAMSVACLRFAHIFKVSEWTHVGMYCTYSINNMQYMLHKHYTCMYMRTKIMCKV